MIINEIESPISVYAKTNNDGYITDIMSEFFIEDFDGWTKIAEGYGDKFAHAQTMFFDKPLKNHDGTYNYKINDIKN